jgi:hypothetical protein
MGVPDVDLPASGYYPNLLIRPSGYGLRYGTPDLTGPGLCTVFSLPLHRGRQKVEEAVSEQELERGDFHK